MFHPQTLLVLVAVSLASVFAQEKASDDLRKEQDKLSLAFGRLPGEYMGSAEQIAADAFARLELETHLTPGKEPPKARFREPEKAAAYFPLGYELSATFENARGEPVTSFEAPGYYGASITVKVKGGKTYGPVRRLVARVAAAPTVSSDVSEEALLRRMAGEQLGRAWREDADPSLFTYALQWWWRTDKAAGRAKPVEYFTVLPPDYEAGKAAGKRYPVYIDLHGSGGLKLTFEKFKADPYLKTFDALAARGAIVVLPLSHAQWQAPAVIDLLDRVEADHAVDPARVYLGGHSMGGSGTWRVLDGAPERFAAAAPVSGGNVPPPIKARRFTGLAVWAAFGGKEGVEGPARTDALVKAINDAGGNARFSTVPDANHMQARNRFFADEALWDWLLAQKKSAAKN